MVNTAIFLADGFEEIEGLTVVDLLRRAGIGIDMVSIQSGRKVTGSHGIRVEADLTFEEAESKEYDMLILPGGMPGTLHLGEHKGLVAKLKEYHANGKMLGAICAAPMVLGENGLLEGKKAVCYPGNEEHLKGAEVLYDEAVADGTIITSRGPGTAIAFACLIIGHFCGEETTGKIKKSLLYQCAESREH